MVQLGRDTLLFTHLGTFVVFKLVSSVVNLRVSPAVELEGLDESEFGLRAYPEDHVAMAEEV
jgi:ammonia channel protein AmtB